MKWTPLHTMVMGILLAFSISFATPFSDNGLLSVQGVNLVNEQGEPVQLRGMSTHGIQWYGDFYTRESIRALAQEWKADVIRLSLYAREGGYYDDPVGYTAKVDQLIEWATEFGLYVLIDWHQLNPGDPNHDKEAAKTYFTHMANSHKDKNNIIYEICNEPNNEGVDYDVSWSVIKSYAEELVPLIRAIDPNKIIIVGTPEWCQRPNDVIGNELAYDNIMYTVHFYAASHKEYTRSNLSQAINNGIPIFVTEFGTQEYTGDGDNDFTSSEIWMDTLDKYNISWVNWNYSPQEYSGAAFQTWVTGTYANCANDANLKDAGLWVKQRIRDRLTDNYTDSVVVDSFANIFSDESKQTHVGAAYGYANGNTANGGGLWKTESDAGGSAVTAGGTIITGSNVNSIVTNEKLAVSMVTSTSSAQYPFAGISCNFIGTGTSYVDLSDLHSIRIKAKGSGTVRVALITKDIDDLPEADRWGYYGNTITLSGATENHVIKATQLFPQDWSYGATNGWSWSHGKGAVRGISITNIDGSSDVSVEIDEILLRGVNYNDFGFTYKEPNGEPVGPTDLSLSNVQVNEKSAGAVIGDLTVTTDDPTATNSFSIDDTRFKVTGTTVSLKDGITLDADNGDVTITITVTDSESRSYSEQFTITVLPVTFVPVVTAIPAQTIAEGGSFAAITLDDYVSDVDNADTELVWSTSATAKITVSITDRVATITTKDENWNGSETVTLTVTDPDGLSASTDVIFTVTAENDEPMVTQIPAQTVSEGGSFAALTLDDFVSDIDNTDDELVWSTSATTKITVSITDRVATTTANDVNWNGSETVTFTVTDPDGLSASTDVIFAVTAENDAPVMTTIPNQIIAEGGSFAAITLDDYVSDVDNADADLVWTTSATTNITVSITNRVATITAVDENWNGSETITFTVTDPDGLSASTDVIFTMTAENDAPVMTTIPAQTVSEGGSFAAITLDDYVSDIDNADDELVWSTSATTNITVTITDRVATISAINENWNGSETVTFTVTDPDGLSASTDVIFTVTNENDAPVMTTIPNQIIAEGGSFAAITLDDYVSDVDNADDELIWSTSTTTNITVTITDRVAIISAIDENWNGSETVTFTVTDPDGLSASTDVIFTVTAENDAPVITQNPAQTVSEGGSFSAITLDDYVSDIDNADTELVWSTSATANIAVSITDRVATITAKDENWNGSETVTFTVTDPDGLSASTDVIFIVTAENDAPVVTQIPAQIIAEGGSFATITLDDYVSDVDNTDDELVWSTSATTNISVSITDRVATLTTADGNWNGNETVTFTVTDPYGLSASTDVIFTVTAENDAPVMTTIPNQGISEGGSFSAITLDDFVSDVDNADDDLVWTTSATTNINIKIIDRVATIAAIDENWNGSETVTLTVTDPDGLSASTDVIFTVTAENDAPVMTTIPAQTVSEGGSFAAITLDDYVSDVDNIDDELIWSTSATTNITVSITNRVATITAIDENWNGNETATFTVTDPDGLSASTDVIFTVTAENDAPVMTTIPAQSTAEGDSFTDITLDDYVSDVDDADADLVWTTLVTTNITVTITDRVATITAVDENWNGSETVTFTVTDPDGLSASTDVIFIVTAENDAPVVTQIPAQIIAEGGSFATITLDDYVSDVDNTDDELVWSTSATTNISVSITDRVATLTTADENWNGSETVTFTVTDPDGLSVSTDAIFTVTAENDAPVMTTIPAQTVSEGGSFAAITLDDYVSDVDNADDELVWSTSTTTNITVSITDRVATISTKDENWNGSETVTFTVTDPDGLSVSADVIFTVTAENDEPMVMQIPAQTIVEGGSFTDITLDDYVSDVDDADDELIWSTSATTNITVSITNRVAIITAIDENWNGSETVIFTVTDPDGLSASTDVVFTVTAENDAPVVTQIPAQIIAEGGSFATITLDDYVSDIDNADVELVWSTSATTNISVSITDRVATLTTADENWNGSETVTFTVTDPDGLSASTDVIFTVTPENDAPVITATQAQSVAEDNALLITMAMVTASDIDGDALTLIVKEGRNYTLNGTTITPVSDYNGPLDVSVTVSDGVLESAVHTIPVTVTPVNDLPLCVTPQKDTTAEALKVTTVDCSENFEDVESDLTFTASLDEGQPLPVWLAQSDGVFTIEPPKEAVGTYMVILSASDDEASAVDTFMVTVEPGEAIEEVDTLLYAQKDIAFCPNPVRVDEERVYFIAPEFLTGQWEILIYDNLGNLLDQKKFIGGAGRKYSWDLRNSSGIPVGAGTYVALIRYENGDGEKVEVTRLIGVNR